MTVTAENSDLLNTKQHFEILDGLRGVAAIAVVIFHFMEFVFPDYKDSFIAHAYLSVDFFFCLSGFVIAYAYDAKIRQIGILNFFKLRLIRLHPLVIIGSIIGLLAFIFDPFSNLFDVYAGKTFLMFLTSCLMIPFPLVPERYFNLFHLNPPTWSLFWEYLANVAYAVILFRIHNKLLWVFTVVAAAFLVYTAKNYEFLGVGFGGDNFLAGAARVFYSFLAGLLAYRSNWIIKNKLGFLTLAILLFLVFLVPFNPNTNWIVDPLIVIFYFPFLVALGAGAILNPALKKICRFSGNISYPLYMIHYPFLWLFLSYIEQHKPSQDTMIMITVAGVTLLVVLAYLVLSILDMPIRRFLKAKS